MAQAISKKERTQTAVEWLMEQMLKPDMYKIWPSLLERAKAMEKEQHSNTWVDSRIHYKGDDYIGKEMSFEDYFNQVYGNTNSN